MYSYTSLYKVRADGYTIHEYVEHKAIYIHSFTLTLIN